MQFHTSRQLEGDSLKLVRIERNNLCSLDIAFHIGFQSIFGKCHVHIRNIRHILAVIIELHCQIPAGIIGTGKCIRAAVGIRSRDMSDNKTLARRKIRILLSEKTFISSCFRSVVADLSQGFSILQFCDLKGAVSRSTPGRLYAVCCSTDIAKLYGIFVGAVTSKAIISIVVICSTGNLDGLCRRSCLQHSFFGDLEACCLTESQTCQVDLFFLCRPLNDTGDSPS